MSEPERQDRAPHPAMHPFVAAVCIVGIALATMAAWVARDDRLEERRGMFESHVTAAAQRLDQRLAALEASVAEQQSSMIVTWPVDRAQFHQLANLATDFGARDEMLGTSFARAVPTPETSVFESSVRDDRSLDPNGIPDFSVFPDTVAADRFVVEFTETAEGPVDAALGLDLGADPLRRTAVEEARDRGASIATAPLRVGTDATRVVVMVASPIYATRTIPLTEPARRRHFIGVLATFVEPASLLRDALGDPDVDVELFDVGPTTEAPNSDLDGRDALLGTAAGRSLLLGDSPSQLRRIVDIDLDGRRWRLVAAPSRTFDTGAGVLPFVVFFGCLALVALVAAVVNTVTGARQRAEALVEKRTAALRQLVAKSPDATLVVDGDGRIVLASDHVERLLGYEPASLIGRSVDDLVPDDRRTGHGALRDEFVTQAQSRALDRNRELTARHLDGSDVPVEISLSTLPEGDTIGRVIASLRDVSVQRRAEAELHHAIDQQTAFLGTVSHELQTPLTAIRGFTRLLLERHDELDPATQIEYLQRILRNSDGLHELISEVLQFTRLEEERRALQLGDVQIDLLVGQVVDSLATVLGDHPVTVAADPATAVADATATVRVMRNLLANAARYSPAGAAIDVTVRDLDDRVEVRVDDAGPGIAAAEHPRVFDRFWRGAGSVGIPGTGIGLAVVKELVSRQHGSVSVGSSPLGGARFEVLLVKSPPRSATTASPVGRAATTMEGASPIEGV